MNLAYFIKHPVVSLVLNAMIVLVGALCFYSLPIREYPDVKLSTLTISAYYPNAGAELVESSVTNILEDKLAGVEGVDVITSVSNENYCSITISFLSSVSMDRALIMVRDAISLARPALPIQVKEPTIQRGTDSGGGIPFMGISIESSSMDFGSLTHYAQLNLKNAFRSLKGVASADIWGQPYAYTITLDNKKLHSFGVNADEVYDALAKANLSLPVGKFQNQIPTTINTELKTIDDYKNLLVKERNFSTAQGAKQHPVFLKSVADVELKTDDQTIRVRVNGKPGILIAINKASDANPLEVSDLVNKQVQEFSQNLPAGLKLRIDIDQAQFIRLSLKNIRASILEAIMCVIVVVFIFLRNVRATLIPIITIPISIIGSLLFLKLFGFSINLMTLLAMVLGIGLVVDDAIVVLENISRHIEEGLSPINAAIKGVKEIGFAIIAMTLTLVSAYAPIAFIEGTIGQIFIEFAVALAGSVLISGVVALTLSPLMCAYLFTTRPVSSLVPGIQTEPKAGSRLTADLSRTYSSARSASVRDDNNMIGNKRMWPQIDLWLDKLSEFYSRSLSYLMKHSKLLIWVAIGSLALMSFLFNLLPNEVAPKEDRGLIGAFTPLAHGQSLDAAEKKAEEIENIIKSTPEAESMITFVGDWGASVVLPLKPRSVRSHSASEITRAMYSQVNNIPSADAYPWSWDSGLPGVSDISVGGGVGLVVSTTESYRDLFNQANNIRKASEERKLFQSIRYELNLDSPGYKIDLDVNKLAELGLNQKQIAKLIEIFFSGDRSLTFQKDGILYPIVLEGTVRPWTLDELYVANRNGSRISLGSVVTMQPTTQPKGLTHYNQMRSVTLNAESLAGEKIESSMLKLKSVASEILPEGYKMTWSGAAKAYKESSSTTAALFVLALVFIYAILAVQFENFIDPLIILFTVPLACIGALLVLLIFGQSLNIYTQVGLITLTGLITKHGVLIVEFANQLRASGSSIAEAIQKAAVLRLRPILMTTGAMIFGSVPLVLSYDYGAECRRAIGLVLVGGLSFGTLLTLFVLPVMYYSVKSFSKS